jgi:hypothetical protein
MRLGARIQKLEEVAAPIKAEQERKRENQRLRVELFKAAQGMFEDLLPVYRYILGDDYDEEELKKDIVEINVLYHQEAMERYGADERGYYKATDEQLKEAHRDVIMRFDRQIFGNYQTVEQHDKEQEQWAKVRADMAAGVESAESEAAGYIRQLFKRYPRRVGAERFYAIWD